MQLASERNIDQVLSEFREYASEVRGRAVDGRWRGLGRKLGPLTFLPESWFTVENHPFLVKGNKYWRYTHLNHEYGRKGENVEIGSFFLF